MSQRKTADEPKSSRRLTVDIALNYKAFRYRAAVDFAEVEFRLTHPSQAIHVSGTLPDSPLSVRGIDPITNAPFGDRVKNSTTSRFRVRFQDPTSMADLRARVADLSQALSRRGNTPLEAFAVTGLELAFDLCARPGTGPRCLAEAAAHMYRRAQVLASENRRLYREKRDKTEPVPRFHDSLVRYLADGWNIGIGDRDADHYQHVYVKITDTIGGNWVALPETLHRARFENRYQGQELAARIGTTLDDLAVLRFESLASHYTFRIPDPAAQSDMACLLTTALLNIGERPRNARRRYQDHARRRNVPVANRLNTRADATLNKHARDALTRLSVAWSRVPAARRASSN